MFVLYILCHEHPDIFVNWVQFLELSVSLMTYLCVCLCCTIMCLMILLSALS